MMRRKGIPGDCCGDTCGNKVRKINGISPDPNGEFNIAAGQGIGITQDQNGITIDASAASGVLTINGEQPDADGNFDGVVTVADAQDITGLKTFKTPIGPFIQVSHPYPGGATDYADIDQYVNNILSNRIRMQRDGATNANSIQLIPRNVTGGTGGLPLSVNYDPATNKMYAMAPVRTYDPVNVNDIVTIGTMKVNAVTIADTQTITGLKTFTRPNNTNGLIIVKREGADSSTAITNGTISFSTNGGMRGTVNNWEDATAVHTQLGATGNTAYQIQVNSSKASASGWAESPYRAYNSANVGDIVTIGSLAANPNVVHTTGNETVNGVKTFTSALSKKSDYDQYGNNTAINLFDNAVNERILGFFINKQSNGIRVLYASIMNSDNSTYTTIELGRST